MPVSHRLAAPPIAGTAEQLCRRAKRYPYRVSSPGPPAGIRGAMYCHVVCPLKRLIRGWNEPGRAGPEEPLSLASLTPSRQPDEGRSQMSAERSPQAPSAWDACRSTADPGSVSVPTRHFHGGLYPIYSGHSSISPNVPWARDVCERGGLSGPMRGFPSIRRGRGCLSGRVLHPIWR